MHVFLEGCNGIINTCLDWTHSMKNRYFMLLWKRVIYILKIFENHILMDFGLIFQFILILEMIFEAWYFFFHKFVFLGGMTTILR